MHIVKVNYLYLNLYFQTEHMEETIKSITFFAVDTMQLP